VSAPALAAAGAAEPALVCDGLVRAIDDVRVLDGVSLAVARGEHVVLFGAARAGKTTLLRVALGLERAAAGRVAMLGHEIAGLRGAARRAALAQIGVVLARDALFGDRTVEENVALGVPAGTARAATHRAVHEALLLVGLKHVEHRKPASLAAGERRRVALARAIAKRPALLVVDEPAGALDPVAAGALHALLAQLRRRLAATLLVATSDPRALAGADRVAFLHGGRIAACDAPERMAARGDPAFDQLVAGRPWGPIAP
jgi:ABC-type transporter Mla maintaining outer membrane lipid asymmetry ATPase subunit MlaF